MNDIWKVKKKRKYFDFRFFLNDRNKIIENLWKSLESNLTENLSEKRLLHVGVSWTFISISNHWFAEPVEESLVCKREKKAKAKTTFRRKLFPCLFVLFTSESIPCKFLFRLFISLRFHQENPNTYERPKHVE